MLERGSALTESANARTPGAYPVIGYRDAETAIAFLKEAFGFVEWIVVPREGGGILHAELALGDAVVMVHSLQGDGPGAPADRFSLYIALDDPDAHYQRAKAAGANVAGEPVDTDYGSRNYSARDPEGYIWNFGTYRPSRP
jgi:uncharacterized glyoxalase superfamily protein PhnB